MTINDFSTWRYIDFSEKDILICALGYESRSYYLLERNFGTRNADNTLIINLEEEYLSNILSHGYDICTLKTECYSYSQGREFQDSVIAFLKRVAESGVIRKIYIDYSAMPRSWYCELPRKVENEVKGCLELIFLYVAGIYPEEYESYPTAGIGCLKLFSGGALPRIDSERTHLIALSYDTRRTQSLLSMLEPEFLIVCYAYDTPEKKKRNRGC